MTNQASTYLELTDAIVRSATLPLGKMQHYLRDTTQPGLAVRLRESGSRSFIYLSTRPGQKGSHKITIGPFPKIKTAAARKQAAILAGQRAAGADLTTQKRAAKQAAIKAAKATSATVGALLEEGGVYEQSLRARDYKNVQTALSALRRNLLPAHKATDIRELSRQDVTEAMAALEAVGKPGAAQDLRRHASAFLTWTTDTMGLTSHNVMSGYRQPKETRMQRLSRKPKGRALADAEIAKVWNAASRMGVFGQLIRLLMLTGMRRSEPSHLTWQQNVLRDRLTLSAHFTKTGKPHSVPRTLMINDVLEAARHYQRASSDLVFPSWKKDGARISGFSQQMKQLIKEAGVEKFTPHDLRRTARTVMSRCGYDDQVQRACIGQAAPSFDQIYNRDEGWQVRRWAFESAHAYLSAVVEGRTAADVVAYERATNPLGSRKAELLAKLAALHAEG